jgi:hypothetical protein
MAPFTLDELQRQYDNFKRVSDHCPHTADSTCHRCHRCHRSSDTHQLIAGFVIMLCFNIFGDLRAAIALFGT